MISGSTIAMFLDINGDNSLPLSALSLLLPTPRFRTSLGGRYGFTSDTDVPIGHGGLTFIVEMNRGLAISVLC